MLRRFFIGLRKLQTWGGRRREGRKNAGKGDPREIAATDHEGGTVCTNRPVPVALHVVVSSVEPGMRIVGPSSNLPARWSV